MRKIQRAIRRLMLWCASRLDDRHHQLALVSYAKLVIRYKVNFDDVPYTYVYWSYLYSCVVIIVLRRAPLGHQYQTIYRTAVKIAPTVVSRRIPVPLEGMTVQVVQIQNADNNTVH